MNSLISDGAACAQAGSARGVPASWEPFYCVLQQDRRTLTAYTSEELAVSASLYFQFKGYPKIYQVDTCLP